MPRDLIAGAKPVRLDVAVLADIRVGDVAAPAHAAAVAALQDAGYSVGLIPVVSPGIAADAYRIHPDFATLLGTGRLCRIGPGAAVACRLALAFDARIFEGRSQTGPSIASKTRVVTLERPGLFHSASRASMDRLSARISAAMGGAPVWAPTSHRAREALMFAAPDWPVTPQDWAPVAPDLGGLAPDAAFRSRPIIGCARIAGSRPARDLAASVTSNPLVGIRHLAQTGSRLLSEPVSAPVEQWPAEQTSFRAFFGKVDLLANPDQIDDDPVPVEALMALSAGVIPYLPESYRDTFRGAALYGPWDALAATSVEMAMTPEIAPAIRVAGQDLIAEVFSPAAFATRVEALISPSAQEGFVPVVHARPAADVLFYSTNGIGMGHLTRQLAIARRLPDRLKPVFVSHSKAVGIVRDFGFMAEHLPYHSAYAQARAHWNKGLSKALRAAIAFYKPRVLVFDGNVPFIGLIDALDASPEVASVWVRRALWGAGRDTQALERAAHFDLVVEPEDLAWSRDEGPTVAHRCDVRIVPPVRILDARDQPAREEACAALGLDPAATNVLVATGSGNNFDMRAIVSKVFDHLAGRAGIGLAVGEWKIATERIDLPPGVVRLTGYPFARHLNAFDLAVAAPGYNTFAEHIAAALPTLWVPNENEQMDQQIARARFAQDARVGLLLRSSAPFDVAACLDQLLDADTRGHARQNASALAAREMSRNGATEVAAIIDDLACSWVARYVPAQAG